MLNACSIADLSSGNVSVDDAISELENALDKYEVADSLVSLAIYNEDPKAFEAAENQRTEALNLIDKASSQVMSVADVDKLTEEQNSRLENINLRIDELNAVFEEMASDD